MKLFLSHIHEEARLALVLKEWLETSFPSTLDAFVSSDIRDIPAGNKWLQDIDGALNECQAFLVLCSPQSLTRPWINFETGCAWIKRVPVIPICHSGLAKASLPRPLSEFQALEVANPSFVDDLISSLASHLGTARIPRIDQVSMRADIARAIEEVFRQPPSNAAPPSVPSNDEAPLLQVLRRIVESGDRGNSAEELAAEERMSEPKMQYYLDELQERGLVHRGAALMGVPPHYRLTPEGRKYLVARGML